MLISIVMPIYKTEAELIKRAVLSIQNQDYHEWELVMVDDSPKDSDWKKTTQDVFSSLNDERIHLKVHENNLGANKARNTGVNNSRGEYVAFIDADDEWDLDYLSCVSKIIQDKHPDIIASGYRVITTTSTFDVINKKIPDGNLYDQLIYRDVVGPTSAVVVKRSSLIGIGGFDEKLPARQDYDTWLRINKAGGTVAYIRESKLSVYRTDRVSISTSSLNHINGTEMVLAKLLSDPTLKEKYPKIKVSHYIESTYFSMCLKRFDLARSYIKKAIKIRVSLMTIAFYIMAMMPWTFKIARKLYISYR